MSVADPRPAVAADRHPTGGCNVAGNHFPNSTRAGLCRLAAVLWRLHLAEAQGGGPCRGAPRHRHAAQLSLLRPRLHPPGRRRPICRPASPRPPPMATSRPGCSPCWHSSLCECVRSSGCLSSPSISWGRPTSLSTITTPSGSAFRPWPASWAPPTGSRSSTCRLLMITHVAAFYLLLRPLLKPDQAIAGIAAAG